MSGLDPPKCKICGHKHWAREPHIFGRKPEPDEPKKPGGFKKKAPAKKKTKAKRKTKRKKR